MKAPPQDDFWECTGCTFVNEHARELCEICGTPMMQVNAAEQDYAEDL
jgi:rRNA maturation endonuclease Nob1